MFLLSIKAGMRAIEIARITWSMVTDAEDNIADAIALENKASKKRGGAHHPAASRAESGSNDAPTRAGRRGTLQSAGHL